jgi:DNA modification methylase
MYLLEGDALEKLESVEDKSVQAVIIDPPYNINKDHWDTIDNYVEWLVSIIIKLERKLKDNGSFLMFHNDMEQIAEIMVSIKKNTKFVFRQMITWNKRFEGSSKKGYLDGYIVKEGNHNWNKMAEYILFYTFDNSHKLKEARERLNVKQTTISKEILSKTGGMTGWYSNLETGKNYPTTETIVPITKHLNITFDDIVPKFRNQKTHHSVWNYDMAARSKIHLTPKPTDLLENILRHVTDEGDTVLDCFAGTGSLAVACKNLKRDCILIEKEPSYCEWIRTNVIPQSA